MVLFKRRETILTEEVYRFLHSIKGTSGTLQLDDLMQISSELLNLSWKHEGDREMEGN